jgi:hypothetical protein
MAAYRIYQVVGTLERENQQARRKTIDACKTEVAED